MAEGRKDDAIAPRQQDQAEGEREDAEEGGSQKDGMIAPIQQDQAEGEPEDVKEDLRAQEKR